MSKEYVKVPPIIGRLIARGEFNEVWMNYWFQYYAEGDEVLNERFSRQDEQVVKAKGLEKHDIGSNEQGSSGRPDQV